MEVAHVVGADVADPDVRRDVADSLDRATVAPERDARTIRPDRITVLSRFIFDSRGRIQWLSAPASTCAVAGGKFCPREATQRSAPENKNATPA
jgi:hypothetical protein